MNYLRRTSVICSILLASAVTLPGGNSVYSQNQEEPTGIQKSDAFSLSVSTGQSVDEQSRANVTLSGVNGKVKVESSNKVTIVAGKSITLKPGTRVSSGGFLYASIESPLKSRKHAKREMRIVTVEEKIKLDEQADLAKSCTRISPFLPGNKRTLFNGGSDRGTISSPTGDFMAISPEQQRKVAHTDYATLSLINPVQKSELAQVKIFETCKPAAYKVLRL